VFFQAIIPIVQEIWTDICIDRNTPVVGGRIVAEYDSLTKNVKMDIGHPVSKSKFRTLVKVDLGRRTSR
jgi:hypothetical protein